MTRTPISEYARTWQPLMHPAIELELFERLSSNIDIQRGLRHRNGTRTPIQKHVNFHACVEYWHWYQVREVVRSEGFFMISFRDLLWGVTRSLGPRPNAQVVLRPLIPSDGRDFKRLTWVDAPSKAQAAAEVDRWLQDRHPNLPPPAMA